jgi:uncharacterized membrane protein
MNQPVPEKASIKFDASHIGALAHLYRAEVYRSTIWRVRFDNTTNWAVVSSGIAISASFSGLSASPLPLVLVGLLVSFFLLIEARRYRYFDVWRVRARVLETEFYVPLLRGELSSSSTAWAERLAHDYGHPRHRISYSRAVGRRLRSNYAWIFAIQGIAYYGKIAVHPTPLMSVAQLWQRASIGPIPGQLAVLLGALFYGGWLCFGIYTRLKDRAHLGRQWYE